MLRLSNFVVLFFISLLAMSSADAEDTSVLKATSISISQELIDMRVKMITTQQGRPDTPELRKAVRDDLINVELISQEALKNGLDKQSETIQQVELARKNVLVNAFIQNYLKSHLISEGEIDTEYSNWKSSLGTKEYNVKHILVDTESEAKSIANKLKKSGKEGNFDKLAKVHSKDAGSKEHGGDLGWIPVSKIPNSFVKSLADTMMNLKNGEISAPVQSQLGWHIIKLENVRDIKIPALNEIRPQIIQRLQQRDVKQMINDLRSKAKIE